MGESGGKTAFQGRGADGAEQRIQAGTGQEAGPGSELPFTGNHYCAGGNACTTLVFVDKGPSYAEQGAKMASFMPWMIFLSAGQMVASTPPNWGRALSSSPTAK